MKPVTRARPVIDRSVCPWLIARLIDRAPEGPALHELARMVREADTGRPDLTPRSAGLLVIPLGLGSSVADDREVPQHGFVRYDALNRWHRELKGATPSRPSTMAAAA